MKMQSGNWLEGRYVESQNSRIDGTWSVDPDFTGTVKAGTVMVVSDFTKRIVVPFVSGKTVVGIAVYPSYRKICTPISNVFDMNACPPYLAGEQIAMVIRGDMDHLLQEDFNASTDYQQPVFLTEKGLFSKKGSLMVGRLQSGEGKQVKTFFDFMSIYQSSSSGSSVDPARVKELEGKMTTTETKLTDHEKRIKSLETAPRSELETSEKAGGKN